MRPHHDNKKRQATVSMLANSDELITARKGDFF
jgi:hypothetical protein